LRSTSERKQVQKIRRLAASKDTIKLQESRN
jgi:hypothetical protein